MAAGEQSEYSLNFSACHAANVKRKFDNGDNDDDDKVVRVGSKTGHCGWGRVVLWWMDLLLNKDRRDSFAPF